MWATAGATWPQLRLMPFSVRMHPLRDKSSAARGISRSIACRTSLSRLSRSATWQRQRNWRLLVRSLRRLYDFLAAPQNLNDPVCWSDRKSFRLQLKPHLCLLGNFPLHVGNASGRIQFGVHDCPPFIVPVRPLTLAVSGLESSPGPDLSDDSSIIEDHFCRKVS